MTPHILMRHQAKVMATVLVTKLSLVMSTVMTRISAPAHVNSR